MPRPGAVVNGWRVLRIWRQDSLSVYLLVERKNEHRLMRMALLTPDSPEGEQQARLLEHEAAALRFFQHPSIIRLHEEGHWPDPATGQRYLLLDAPQGRTLLEWRRSGISYRQLLQLTLHLSQVMQAMHARAMLHGAIHLDNILVRKRDDLPILFDFIRATWPDRPQTPEAGAISPAQELEGLHGLFAPHVKPWH